MGTVYALLVGIDDYPDPLHAALRGCVNDIRAVRVWLDERLETPLSIVELPNDKATSESVVAGIRDHLGQAGPDDVALLWYSGHGTELEIADPAHEFIEATGRCQALVCFDGPLLDKELGALLDAVSATGAHTVAVLDCCFAGGATKAASDLTARFVPPDPSWRTRDGAACAVAADSSGPSRHVLLAASQVHEQAYEDEFAGDAHGLFTHGLLHALRAAAPGASYRDVLAAAYGRVRAATDYQHPLVQPTEPGGAADRPVLGGAIARPRGPHLLRYGRRHGWEVDCGRAHGLPAGAGGTEFTVVGDAGTAAGQAVVRAERVEPARTLVRPLDDEPDRDRAHPVALSALALAPCAVTVEGGDPALSAAIAARPLLRLAEHGALGADLGFRVAVEDGVAQVLRRDGSLAVAPLPPERVPDCLAHLARWHTLRDLENPASALTSHVDVEIHAWSGERVLPDGGGEFVRAYAEPEPGFEPQVSIRIVNRSQVRLWCVLIDLTDSYAAHTALYPGHFVGAGRTGFALDGEPIQLSLPASRPVVPGASVCDWLKLVVAEGELSTVPFHLDPWDPYAPVGARGADPVTATGVLRLTGPAGTKDLGAARSSPGHWATRTFALRTVVPDRPSGVSGPGG
ncbi:caspase domain-containing protein [Embleya sp. NBC_00896]|uniref:caspase family protein n=1 Tax=Embleya sp. NBC_00896 TaxID=2975961 RepID=UPI003869B539|nr:caspase family protein [Embleya sp. NBC_00896]